MRVYHFVNKEYGLENIRKRRLKIATINELNDPFELFGVDLSNPEVRMGFTAMKSELSRNRGLLCFSKSWRNPVQWSHYADKHKGLCLGFDVPAFCLGEVNYSRKRLVSDIEDLSNPRSLSVELVTRLLFTKYQHWSYEQEVRSFVTLDELDKEKKLYFADFSERLQLREVIVGAMSDVKRSEIADALGDLNDEVSTFKTRLAFKTYRVVKQRNKSLWS